MLHDHQRRKSLALWREKIDAVVRCPLDSIRLDLTRCRCPLGCCTASMEAIDNVQDLLQFYPGGDSRLTVIVVGLSDGQKMKARDMYPPDRLQFDDDDKCL